MKIIPWRVRQSPFAAFQQTPSRLLHLFDQGLESHLPDVFRSGGAPPIELAESEEEFIANIELPGMEKADISVQLLSNQMVVSGERKWEESKADKNYYRVESQYGEFRRVIDLPDGLRLDPDGIVAIYEKGVLSVRIPKAERRSATKITVRSGEDGEPTRDV